MDEPFGALDEIVRDHLNEQLLKLWAKTKKTAVFVTHSIPEAIRIGNRILLLTPHPGRAKAELNSDGIDRANAGGELLSARIQRILFDGQGGQADG
jgi:NitT/TauT family transport system ATP-binding protein